MNITLIHNTDAGDDDQLTPGQLIALIEKAGHDVCEHSIKSKGWSKSLENPADLIAVAGGDGTVGKVARRMVGKATAITILPSGTANNIARSLGIADWDASRLVAGWRSAELRSFDAGIATGPWGKRHFIEGVGMGLFTHAMPWIGHREQMLQPSLSSDRIADARQQLREHLQGTVALQLNAALDGMDISGRYVLFEVMNSRYVGPNLFLAPDLGHGDGLLHVVCATDGHRESLDAYLAELQQRGTWPAELTVHIGKRLEIEWTGYAVHLDDRAWPEDDDATPTLPVAIEVTVERAALRFLVPAQILVPPPRK